MAGRAGALFLLLLGVLACDELRRPEEPVVLELQADTVRLAPGVRLVEVRVGGAERATEFVPADVVARIGDVVRFTAADARTHAIIFDARAMQAEAVTFLERTGQLRSPPLLQEGASWILSFDGAPAGFYPFRCGTHGGVGRLVMSLD